MSETLIEVPTEEMTDSPTETTVSDAIEADTHPTPAKAPTKTRKARTAKVTRPNELAKQLKVDPKRLRAWLRKEHARPATAKNTDWALTPAQVKAARKHFAKSKNGKA